MVTLLEKLFVKKKTAFPPFFDFGRVKYPKSRLSKRLKGASKIFFKRGGAVGLFPGEVRAPEMAISGSFRIERPS